MTSEQIEAFLKDLTALAHKHKLVIDSSYEGADVAAMREGDCGSYSTYPACIEGIVELCWDSTVPTPTNYGEVE
jgi:hypothetical protein